MLRALFPRFFRLNAGAGAVAAAALLVAGLLQGWPPALLWGAAGALAIAGCNVVSLGLVPSINAARDAGEAAAGRFAALHRLSVILTLAALILAAAVLVTGVPSP